MNKAILRLSTVFVAGAIFGVALSSGWKGLPETQRIRYHHPDYSKGGLKKTERPLDVAIKGRGYFEFQAPDGTSVYSRRSDFFLNNTGNLCASFHSEETAREARKSGADGYTLQPVITIPPDFTQIRICSEGIVSMIQDGQTAAPSPVGCMQLCIFQNADGLELVEDGMLVATERSGAPLPTTPGLQGSGLLLQGYTLERKVDRNAAKNLIVNGKNVGGPDDRVQEALIETGRRQDYAIEGRGFARVVLPDGQTGYTRYLPLDTDDDRFLYRRYPHSHMRSQGLPISRETRERPEGWVDPTPGGSWSISARTLDTEIIAGLRANAPAIDASRIPTPIPTPRRTYRVTDVTEPKRIQLFRFPYPENLAYYLNGIYLETESSDGPVLMDATAMESVRLIPGHLNDVPYLEP